MEFKDLLKNRRAEIGVTLEDVGNIVGVSKATVQRWESGAIKNIRRDKIEKLAIALKTTPGYLMGWNDSNDCSNNNSRSEDSVLDVPNIFPYNPIKRIPILGHISAGLPLYAEEQIEGYTYTDLNGGSEYFALRVTGDSMTAARIFDGDLLIVRRQPEVENEAIAVVMVNEENATVKRFNRTGDIVTLSPQSFNPAHKPQIYDLKTTSIKILGLVVKIEVQVN
jgi:repressor LexA